MWKRPKQVWGMDGPQVSECWGLQSPARPAMKMMHFLDTEGGVQAEQGWACWGIKLDDL